MIVFRTRCVHIVYLTSVLLITFGVASGQVERSPSESMAVSDKVDVSVALHGSQVVKAGENVEFVITLDKEISYHGAVVQLQIKSPEIVYTTGFQVRPGIKVYHHLFGVPYAAPGGTWTLVKVIFSPGAGHPIDLAFNTYSFQVIPNVGLTFPSKADIGVNPSQVQLLRTEAVRLQTRIRELKAALADKSTGQQLVKVLSQNVDESLAALQTTATKFRSLSSDAQQSSASQVFFDDLRRTYEEAAGTLQKSGALKERNSAFKKVTFSAGTDVPDGEGYVDISQGVLRALEQNEIAYTIVADAQSLLFDLTLSSTPQGAATSVRRKGDNFRSSGQQTDCTIKALPYAVWLIRFEKQGYKSEVREHDPFREPNHVVNVTLQK